MPLALRAAIVLVVPLLDTRHWIQSCRLNPAIRRASGDFRLAPPFPLIETFRLCPILLSYYIIFPVNKILIVLFEQYWKCHEEYRSIRTSPTNVLTFHYTGITVALFD